MIQNNTFNLLIHSNALNNIVPNDELGKNWVIFEVFAVIISILPWIVLILYITIWKKYYLSYFVNGELVHKKAYKKDQIVEEFSYTVDDVIVTKWYLDADFKNEVNFNKMPKTNVKLYGFYQVEDTFKEDNDA